MHSVNSFAVRVELKHGLSLFTCLCSRGCTAGWPTALCNFVTIPPPSLQAFGWHGPSKTLPSHLLNMAGAYHWPTLLVLSSCHVRKALTPFSPAGCAGILYSQQILLLFPNVNTLRLQKQTSDFNNSLCFARYT